MARCLFWDCHDSYDWIFVTINNKYALRGVYSTGKLDCQVLNKIFCIGTKIGQNTMKELTIFGLVMPKTLLQYWSIWIWVLILSYLPLLREGTTAAFSAIGNSHISPVCPLHIPLSMCEFIIFVSSLISIDSTLCNSDNSCLELKSAASYSSAKSACANLNGFVYTVDSHVEQNRLRMFLERQG